MAIYLAFRQTLLSCLSSEISINTNSSVIQYVSFSAFSTACFNSPTIACIGTTTISPTGSTISILASVPHNLGTNWQINLRYWSSASINGHSFAKCLLSALHNASVYIEYGWNIIHFASFIDFFFFLILWRCVYIVNTSNTMCLEGKRTKFKNKIKIIETKIIVMVTYWNKIIYCNKLQCCGKLVTYCKKYYCCGYRYKTICCNMFPKVIYCNKSSVVVTYRNKIICCNMFLKPIY